MHTASIPQLWNEFAGEQRSRQSPRWEADLATLTQRIHEIKSAARYALPLQQEYECNECVLPSYRHGRRQRRGIGGASKATYMQDAKWGLSFSRVGHSDRVVTEKVGKVQDRPGHYPPGLARTRAGELDRGVDSEKRVRAMRKRGKDRTSREMETLIGGQHCAGSGREEAVAVARVERSAAAG